MNRLGLGLGTTNPTRSLHIEGGTTSTGLFFSNVNYMGTTDVIAVAGNSVTQAGYGIGGEFTGGYKGLNVINDGGNYSGQSYGIYSDASGSSGVRIGVYAKATGGTTNWSMYSQGDSYFGGDIKVGTQTDPFSGTYKVVVDGKILAEEVRIQNSSTWPDYVFENYFEGNSKLNPTYEFLALEEVEQFIEKNHHLPGVPSAIELEKEGMSLKEMNLILLEKVEELTLYLIEQQKEIEALKKTISSSKE